MSTLRQQGYSTPALPTATTRVLLVTDAHPSYQTGLALLNMLPAVLGSHYLVVAVALADAPFVVDDEHFDLAILDLAAAAGLALLHALRADRPALPLLLLSDANLTTPQRQQAAASSALLLERPVDAAGLRAAVGGLLYRSDNAGSTKGKQDAVSRR